jgi:hypothetical protein
MLPEPPSGVSLRAVAQIAHDVAVLARGDTAAVAVLLTRLGRLVRDIQRAHLVAARTEQSRRAAVAAEHRHVNGATPKLQQRLAAWAKTAVFAGVATGFRGLADPRNGRGAAGAVRTGAPAAAAGDRARTS